MEGWGGFACGGVEVDPRAKCEERFGSGLEGVGKMVWSECCQ